VAAVWCDDGHVKVFGQHDADTVAQLERCAAAEPNAPAVLCADGHLGYSMPIGGVVGYRSHVSPSGVGYDIACGNLAVRTNLQASDVADDEMRRLARQIEQRITFGVGGKNHDPVADHPVFDRIADSPVGEQRALLDMARSQLGTVGAGNHYVDVLEDETGRLWVAVHFGSRGFGYKTANGFMNIARGRRFDAGHGEGEMKAPPLLLPLATPRGQDYLEAMAIAGEYAYAGREAVAARVLQLMGATTTDSVHNHHNFAWRERHHGDDLVVIRKGATPAFPGQRGFIGGSMADVAVVVRGRDTSASADALFSTVHGAGRIMSRTKAAGKVRRVRGRWQSVTPGAIDFDAALRDLDRRGIILRGGGADEAPGVYRPLRDVLAAHAGTIDIEHTLTPRIVVMAGTDVRDPYRD
jgi:tRNA-splicing ligase RtcB (3'-phosphate/5'-hydroxy nucleic acid ligase)